MNKTQIFIAMALIFVVAAGYLYDKVSDWFEDEPIISAMEEMEERHGEVKQYTTSGKLKTIVNYDHGVKDGMSYLYHTDGKTVLLAMPYVQGKREGTSKKYFETGDLYAETTYVNDKLHGTRTIYYRSGKVKTTIDYWQSFPGIGIQEYLTNGTKKESNKITYIKKGDLIRFNTSSPCKNTKFYIGSLEEDKYLDALSEKVRLLPEDEYGFYVDLSVYTPSFLSVQDIICSCKSTQGNPIVMKKRINL